MKILDGRKFDNEIVIIRVDFNVPLNDSLEVLDNTRIEAAKPTIDYIIDNGGACVLISHLGRPKGFSSLLSLKNIVFDVSKVLNRPVQFHDDCIGEIAFIKSKSLKKGEILLLENLRFYEEETLGDKNFSEKLSKLGTCYVNDAFGTAHRAHASTTIISQFFKNKKFFGKLLEKEVKSIEKVMKSGERPVLAILGGAKVSSKITIIESMLDKIDHLIIGGGMVYTFIKAQGGRIGDSICEDQYCDLAIEILKKAKDKNVLIHLPTDVVAGDDFSNNAEKRIYKVNEIPDGWQGMDAGPNSINYFKSIVLKCRTILWNGPLGVFEFSNFANGTLSIGKAIANQTSNGAFSLVGGGDSVSAVKDFGLQDQMSYVSTGGGAMLESLEGKILPGIEALQD
jgi:phosphoglycerate kinase